LFAASQSADYRGSSAAGYKCIDAERKSRVSEEILINVTPRETRVALVENGMLQEVYIERASGAAMSATSTRDACSG
jgi:hypothetical protein